MELALLAAKQRAGARAQIPQVLPVRNTILSKSGLRASRRLAGEAYKPGMDTFDLGASGFDGPVVVDDIVGERNLLRVGDLCGNAAACVGLDLVARRRAGKL